MTTPACDPEAVLSGQDDRGFPVQQFTEEPCTNKYGTQGNKKFILPCFSIIFIK